MSGLVVDASVLIRALAENPDDAMLRRRLAGARRLHAPSHLGAEFLNGIRGLALGGKLTDMRSHQAIDDFLDLPIVRHPVEGMAAELWALRHNFTVYDGAYVTLAQLLGLALLTLDDKIKAAAPDDVDIQVYPRSDQ